MACMSKARGGIAVLLLVVDKERRLGRKPGDVDRRAVDVRQRLHLVDVAGADEVVKVMTKLEGVETVSVQLFGLVVEGSETVSAGVS